MYETWPGHSFATRPRFAEMIVSKVFMYGYELQGQNIYGETHTK
jgi:hypothetical protein